MEEAAENVYPSASTFVPSPLRNRMRVELEAPISEVWTLMGDLARFPEYSLGLEKVEARVDPSGACTVYVCHFKPEADGEIGVVHRELMRWYEPGRGWASIAEEGNVFGLTDSLTLVTLEPNDGSTVVTWSQYFDAGDLDTSKAVFNQALADLGENLAHRFGGKVIERYDEP